MDCYFEKGEECRIKSKKFGFIPCFLCTYKIPVIDDIDDKDQFAISISTRNLKIQTFFTLASLAIATLALTANLNIVPKNISSISEVLKQSKSSYSSYIKKLTSLGPFPSGEHVLDKQVAITFFPPIVKEIETVRERVKSFFIVVVGKTDKHLISNEDKLKWNSNSELALARAKWVVEQLEYEYLKKQLSPPTFYILPYTQDSYNHEFKKYNSNEDRIVEIFYYGTQ